MSCDFLYQNQAICDSYKKDIYNDLDQNCDYYYQDPYDSSNKYECTDSNFIPITHSISITGESFGEDSRCFDVSTLRTSGSNPSQITRCYKAVCDKGANQITVTVGSTTVICTIPGAKVSVIGYLGKLTCPKNF